MAGEMLRFGQNKRKVLIRHQCLNPCCKKMKINMYLKHQGLLPLVTPPCCLCRVLTDGIFTFVFFH